MKSPRKPNILFLMDDQHRSDSLGCAGHPAVRTPVLDALAGEGVCFSRAYSSVPSCTPARAALLTGRSPWGHGMLGYGDIAPRYDAEKPRLLAKAGYRTAAIGKNHFEPPRNAHGYETVVLEEGWYSEAGPRTPFKCDYIRFFEQAAPGENPNATGLGYNDRTVCAFPFADELHPTHFTAQRAIDYLNAYKSDEPFFLKVSFQRPHPPYDPPRRFLDMFKDAAIPSAAAGAWSTEAFGDFGPPCDPWAPRANLGPEAVRETRQGYYAAIAFVDEQIGRLLAVLRARGLADNTLILFTSDHGEMAGDHHLWRKTYAFEGSARVPMILWWGDDVLEAPRGRRLDQLVELRDVLPTFLDAAGSPTPPTVEGRSMLDLIRGRSEGWRTTLDLEHAACYWPASGWTALTDARHKYIYHSFDGRQQLFDLANDPLEQNDLAGEQTHATVLGAWRSRMIEHLAVRGEAWVKGGDLALQPQRILYGANYPQP
ncbi:MAG: arylsulfatase [Planctomycetota bacterium]|nr:arylsulfatase [Planctomycetota bacterium]